MSEPIRSSISLDDYDSLISAMERELEKRAAKLHRGDAYISAPIEALDISFSQEPAYSCFCYRDENDVYIEVRDEELVWSFGNPDAKARGGEKLIAPGELLVVHWMCFLTIRPVLYIGSSGLWDAMLYLRGAVGPFIGSRDNGGISHIVTTAEKLLASDSEKQANEEFAIELEKRMGEPGAYAYLRALRESLLFFHPEFAVSYAAWMGSTNLTFFGRMLEGRIG